MKNDASVEEWIF